MNWELISLPIVAAVIGWGTNVIAIRMLFWPRSPFDFSVSSSWVYCPSVRYRPQHWRGPQ